MTIVSIANQKGGVGKTTTAINLSSALARAGKKILLVDLDPQANSTAGMGFEPEESAHSMSDVLLGEANIADIIKETRIPGLFLAPSDWRLGNTEQKLIPMTWRETYLHKSLNTLTPYDYIFIDSHPSLGLLTVNAVFASDFILIPCDMGRYSLEGFGNLMNKIAEVKGNGFDRKKQMRIFLTKFQSSAKVSNNWVFNQLKPYSDMMLKTRIRQNEALNQAAMLRKPIWLTKSKSPGAEDYGSLMKELTELWQNQ